MNDRQTALNLADECKHLHAAYSNNKRKKSLFKAFDKKGEELIVFLTTNFPKPTTLSKTEFNRLVLEAKTLMRNSSLSTPYTVSDSAFPIFVLITLLKNNKIPILKITNFKKVFATEYTTVIMNNRPDNSFSIVTNIINQESYEFIIMCSGSFANRIDEFYESISLWCLENLDHFDYNIPIMEAPDHTSHGLFSAGSSCNSFTVSMLNKESAMAFKLMWDE